jgi:hypothetical protein
VDNLNLQVAGLPPLWNFDAQRGVVSTRYHQRGLRGLNVYLIRKLKPGFGLQKASVEVLRG